MKEHTEIRRKFVPRVCRSCPDPHVENCPRCFGWGLTHDGSPISAHAAYAGISGWKTCSVCGGTPPKPKNKVGCETITEPVFAPGWPAGVKEGG